ARFDNALWLIEAQPVRGPPTAVVTGNHKALISKLFHYLDEIACHLAKAEIDVVWARLWERAIAVAAQVRKDDMVLLGQLRGHLVPAGVVPRIARDEQQRRARAAVTEPNYGSAGAHIEVFKAGELRRHVGRTPTRRVAPVVVLGRRRH